MAPVKHGRAGTNDPTYESWKHMRSRCNTITNKNYDRYGGRGITICKRWDDFNLFLEDMGECPVGLTLDRIKNNQGYKPSNCQWADRKQQAQNRDPFNSNPPRGERSPRAKISERQARKIISLKGKMLQRVIAEKFGIKQSQVSRIHRGVKWSHLQG